MSELKNEVLSSEASIMNDGMVDLPFRLAEL